MRFMILVKATKDSEAGVLPYETFEGKGAQSARSGGRFNRGLQEGEEEVRGLGGAGILTRDRVVILGSC